MDNMIRILCAINKISLINFNETYLSIESLLNSSFSFNPDIIIFPEYSTTGTSLSSLFNSTILFNAKKTLGKIITLSKNHRKYILIGLPINYNNSVISVIAVIYNGDLLGYVPADQNIKANSNYPLLLPPDTLFNVGEKKFSVLSCTPDLLSFYAPKHINSGADIIVCPTSLPCAVTNIKSIKDTLSLISKSFSCAIALSNLGPGETSSPYIYKGLGTIYENGICLDESEDFFESFTVAADIDSDIIGFKKKNMLPLTKDIISLGRHNLYNKSPAIRKISRNPYYTKNYQNFDYIEELFSLQYTSLALRLKNTGINKMILGVSGGLDSTLALLACIKALDILNLPRENLICVTMPGLGTSTRTFNNSLVIVEALGTSLRQIPIKNAVLQHFTDINHDPNNKNTTYENAQARERTQILLDIGNTENAIVVGTADLSETALGFCTFGGDSIASFNINSCISKTIMKQMISFLSATKDFIDVADILNDILNTPISPELISSDNSSITQSTETILGPYELHDFFLYYFIKHSFSFKKIYEYACAAFYTDYNPSFIKQTLKTFVKRILSSQFKRNCSPDFAKICDITVSSLDFFIPSDLNLKEILGEIDKL